MTRIEADKAIPDDAGKDRVIMFNSDYIVIFYDNGEMQINEKYTTTEAAKAFWEIVKSQASRATPADIRKAALAAYDAPIHQDASLNSLVNKESREVVLEAIARAILAERERCAVIAENYSGMSHAAFDLGSKSFPTKSPVPDFIAKQIRGEA